MDADSAVFKILQKDGMELENAKDTPDNMCAKNPELLVQGLMRATRYEGRLIGQMAKIWEILSEPEHSTSDVAATPPSPSDRSLDAGTTGARQHSAPSGASVATNLPQHDWTKSQKNIPCGDDSERKDTAAQKQHSPVTRSPLLEMNTLHASAARVQGGMLERAYGLGGQQPSNFTFGGGLRYSGTEGCEETLRHAQPNPGD